MKETRTTPKDVDSLTFILTLNKYVFHGDTVFLINFKQIQHINIEIIRFLRTQNFTNNSDFSHPETDMNVCESRGTKF